MWKSGVQMEGIGNPMNTAAGFEDMLEGFQGARRLAWEGEQEAPLSCQKPLKDFDVTEGSFLLLLQRAAGGPSEDLGVFTGWFRGGGGQELGMRLWS